MSYIAWKENQQLHSAQKLHKEVTADQESLTKATTNALITFFLSAL
jgi:hypothetical protein